MNKLREIWQGICKEFARRLSDDDIPHRPPQMFLQDGRLHIERCYGRRLQIIFKHSSSDRRLTITPDNREVIYIDDTKEYWIGDGFTPGGIFLLAEPKLLQLYKVDDNSDLIALQQKAIKAVQDAT